MRRENTDPLSLRRLGGCFRCFRTLITGTFTRADKPMLLQGTILSFRGNKATEMRRPITGCYARPEQPCKVVLCALRPARPIPSHFSAENLHPDRIRTRRPASHPLHLRLLPPLETADTYRPCRRYFPPT
ncbi:hypothetical protein SLNWT_4091 [Streptomyces albus]|uniref:Uncharacterized protein n=1 Tax=Streptomyces albus (strain ATCC 21838 / DSM 41398 / FERM P-419 / JCM 4703 / NBRC 107858) TaxID=1081613 RepID=A0A0B5F2C5_STRA4|nr:hypothetical protein SLNWT_4091 [Streptomyces albus]AOU78778.1 hypothetical protein SLNHY_4087 [Streptomyces albus]